MPLIRFLFVAVPVIRRFLRSRQGKAAMAKGRAQMDKRAQKRAAQRTAATRRR
ncbi:hypothetical protein ITJ44_09975 [Clavibacter sp. VKM Ac-2873]|uniref:hypothetical protein n=1 Tax=Clavibacter sp. VKM Ac-2873 TaxID=2783813 RepID=UPI00188CEBFA|nr:hypothetical protein [Clavibacter sp. VKM Ac-2873]MBF4618400.1 hypothetical protein [Clavibacter sp. VKM Ac-2873]